jgi:hypothetical protein
MVAFGLIFRPSLVDGLVTLCAISAAVASMSTALIAFHLMKVSVGGTTTSHGFDSPPSLTRQLLSHDSDRYGDNSKEPEGLVWLMVSPAF